uniref:Uncharacterized protein n=1 Tax=Pristionchus pacificus TaxID=54126 RepID=A0A2A6CVR2_PRIPA|eukprot:PDM82137.1 hypothetical protein PRIPAC_36530 [Pristionchus pacificus]
MGFEDNRGQRPQIALKDVIAKLPESSFDDSTKSARTLTSILSLAREQGDVPSSFLPLFLFSPQKTILRGNYHRVKLRAFGHSDAHTVARRALIEKLSEKTGDKGKLRKLENGAAEPAEKRSELEKGLDG